MDSSAKEFELYQAKVRYTITVGLLTALTITLVVLAPQVLLLAFGAVLFAIFLHGLAQLVQHFTGLNHWLAMAIGVAAIIGFFTVSIVVAAPSIEQQFERLTEQFPEALQSAREFLVQLPYVGPAVQQVASEFSLQGVNLGGRSVLEQVTNIATTSVGMVLNIFLIILAGIFIMVHPGGYVRSVIALFPPKKRDRATAVFKEVGEALKWWIAGRLFSMAVIGIATTVGLMLLGIPLAFILGLFAAVITFIPNIGPILSAIPAVLLGFAESPVMALYVLLLYVGIQLVESNLLTPLVERRTISIRPAFLLIVQIFFGLFFGILGLTFASPLIAAGIVLTRELYIKPMEQGEKRLLKKQE